MTGVGAFRTRPTREEFDARHGQVFRIWTNVKATQHTWSTTRDLPSKPIHIVAREVNTISAGNALRLELVHVCIIERLGSRAEHRSCLMHSRGYVMYCTRRIPPLSLEGALYPPKNEIFSFGWLLFQCHSPVLQGTGRVSARVRLLILVLWRCVTVLTVTRIVQYNGSFNP